MNIQIKTPEEIEKMRAAGADAAKVLEMIIPHVQAGVTTEALDQLCHDYMVDELKVIPAPLNYKGFPKSICTSVNHVICHGIPSDKKLKEGDIVNIDVTVIKDGYHGDTSRMYHVGQTSIQAQRLCEITQQSLYEAIKLVKPGAHFGDIGAVIQRYIEQHHYSVVRDFCGHGIGREFHEEPQVVHFGRAGTGQKIKEGMCFTIEPMVNVGKHQCKILKDGWTAVTKDRSLSAQWEHTLAVTSTGVEVLTLRAEEDFPRVIFS